MARLSAKDVLALLKEAFSDWMDDKATKLAAALTYYTVISLAPLVVIGFMVASRVFFTKEHPKDTIESQVNTMTGGVGGDLVRQIMDSSSEPGAGVWATILSVAVLLFGASGVFGELQDSMNTIWEVKPKPGRGILATIKDRFMSLSMVFGIGFLFILSVSLSTVIGFVSGNVTDRTVGESAIVTTITNYTIDVIVSTIVVTVLFAAIYRLLPDVKIAWRDVWTGAIITAILFQLGKYGLTIYFHFSSTANAYGAAGSLIALLVWLYYSSQILFFGAEVTQVYARKHGSGIVPAKNALPVTADDRANLGLGAGVRDSSGFAPPQVVRITPPPAIKKQVVKPVAVGGAGIVTGVVVGAVAAWVYRKMNYEPTGMVAKADLALDERLDKIEQRIRTISATNFSS